MRYTFDTRKINKKAQRTLTVTRIYVRGIGVEMSEDLTRVRIRVIGITQIGTAKTD